MDVRITGNHGDIEPLLRDLSLKEVPAAVVSALNRAGTSARGYWADLILARYRARSLRRKDVTDQVQLAKANFSNPFVRLRIRERGLSLAKFIPRGTLATQERYRAAGGWRRKGRRGGGINERTPRVGVQVLARSIARTLKGAFVLQTGAADGGGYIVLRKRETPGARGGRYEKLFASSIYSQGRRVIDSPEFAEKTQERFITELTRDVARRAERRARRQGPQRPV